MACRRPRQRRTPRSRNLNTAGRFRPACWRHGGDQHAGPLGWVVVHARSGPGRHRRDAMLGHFGPISTGCASPLPPPHSTACVARSRGYRVDVVEPVRAAVSVRRRRNGSGDPAGRDRPIAGCAFRAPDSGKLPRGQRDRNPCDLIADGFGPGVNGLLLSTVKRAGRVSRIAHRRNGSRYRVAVSLASCPGWQPSARSS